MNALEQNLKQSLRRKDAPRGFADRVLEKLDDASVGGGRRRHLSGLLSRIAAVLLVGTIGTGAWVQHQKSAREQREAEQASVLVKIALHIASEKTNIAREHLTKGSSDAKTTRKEGNDEQQTKN